MKNKKYYDFFPCIFGKISVSFVVLSDFLKSFECVKVFDVGFIRDFEKFGKMS